MKKYFVIILIALLLLALFWFVYYFLVKQVRTYDLEEVPEDVMLDFPLDTPYEAAIYTKLSQDVYRSIKAADASTNTPIQWTVRTEHILYGENDGVWKVNVHSQHLIPSFSCLIGFTPDGERVSQLTKVDGSTCSWNK